MSCYLVSTQILNIRLCTLYLHIIAYCTYPTMQIAGIGDLILLFLNVLHAKEHLLDFKMILVSNEELNVFIRME